MTELKVLTVFISSWAWTIISMIFLTSGALFLKGDFTVLDLVLGVMFLTVSVICFYIGLKRKREALGDE